MDTYTTGRSQIGHYRVPGSHLTYCGRTAGTPSKATRVCRPCVKAEARDRAEATATAEAWLDPTPATARPETAEKRAARASVRNYIAREFPPVAALLDIDPEQAAADAAATAPAANAAHQEAMTTWRAEWISARAASPTPTLFDVEPETEQGALFA